MCPQNGCFCQKFPLLDIPIFHSEATSILKIFESLEEIRSQIAKYLIKITRNFIQYLADIWLGRK